MRLYHNGWTRHWWHILGKWEEKTQNNRLVSLGSKHQVSSYVRGTLGDQQVHIVHIVHILYPFAYYKLHIMYVSAYTHTFTVCMHISGAWQGVWLGIVCISSLLCKKDRFSVGCDSELKTVEERRKEIERAASVRHSKQATETLMNPYEPFSAQNGSNVWADRGPRTWMCKICIHMGFYVNQKYAVTCK